MPPPPLKKLLCNYITRTLRHKYISFPESDERERETHMQEAMSRTRISEMHNHARMFVMIMCERVVLVCAHAKMCVSVCIASVLIAHNKGTRVDGCAGVGFRGERTAVCRYVTAVEGIRTVRCPTRQVHIAGFLSLTRRIEC